MSEVGLVRFARLALEVSQAVLPAQRTKFSKRQFAQPQLLAVLCLMRYEDWTFREAEVRLDEHAELRSALELNSVPDFTTLYRFLARLDPHDVARVMNEIVRRMPGRWRSLATIPNATTPSAASSSRHKASFRPNAAPVAGHPVCACRCGRNSPKNSMENAPLSKVSSRR
jgi:hypothetical protein